MKVLALVVLVLAVSGLEAGVVKREVPAALQPVAEWWQNIGDSLQKNFQEMYEKLSSQDLVKQINADQLQAQAQDLAKKAQDHAEPWRAEAEKFFQDLIKKFQ